MEVLAEGWLLKKKFLTDLGGSFSWLGWLFIYGCALHVPGPPPPHGMVPPVPHSTGSNSSSASTSTT